MSIIEQEVKTTLTVPHLQLISALEHLDVEIVIEGEFPPYWVDCYLPDYHVAFEADGPSHSQIKDKNRDDVLMINYALPVFRISSEDLDKGKQYIYEVLILELLEHSWKNSVIDRKMHAWQRGTDFG